MVGTERFIVFVAVSLVAFVAVIAVALRSRPRRPWGAIASLALVVVVGGMVFARWGQNAGLPWWIYYTVPAVATFAAPPLVLRMKTREAVRYLVMAVLMAPAIHVLFSFFLGWHDYMPFVHVPSLYDLF